MLHEAGVKLCFRSDTASNSRNVNQSQSGGARIDLREGAVFDLGDRRLVAYEVPGHSAGSVVLHDATLRDLAAARVLTALLQADHRKDEYVAMLPEAASEAIKTYRQGGHAIPILSNNSFRRNYILKQVGAAATRRRPGSGPAKAASAAQEVVAAATSDLADAGAEATAADNDETAARERYQAMAEQARQKQP